MSWIDGVGSRMRALFRRESEEQELAEDIEFHLAMEAEKLEREGYDPASARRLARIRFGGVERAKEQARDQRGTRWLEDAWTDLRYGWRRLRASPVFTVTTVLTLALGIGATAAVFTLVDGVLLRPLPMAEPSELVELRELGQGRRFYPSYPNFVTWREQAASFSGVVSVRPFSGPTAVLDAGEPTVVPVLGVSRDFLAVLGVEPFLGRDFTADENTPGGDDVALVSHAFWSTRLGGDPDLSRLRFTVFGQSYQVVGVLPPRFRFLYDADVYYPDERWPGTSRSSHSHRVVGRLVKGSTLELAKSEMDRIAAGVNEEFPGDSQAETVEVRRLEDEVLGDYRRPLHLLLWASALVLLLACANVASTILARGSARTNEIHVRASLGAGRGRILRQLVTESFLLAGLGAVVGAALAYGVVAVAASLGSGILPRLDEIGVGHRTILAVVTAAFASALASGVYPAIRLVRASASIRPGPTRGSSEGNGRVWDVLLACEGASAVVLLVGASLLVQSLLTIVRQDRGWEPDGVLAMSVTIPAGVFDSSDEAVAAIRRLKDELAAIPGVDAVGMGSFSPLGAGNMTAPVREAGTEPRMDNFTGWRLVDEDYFGALGVDLIRGRLLEPTDTHAGIVNLSLARFLWGEEDPVGKYLLSNYDSQGEPIEVVGVVEDARDWRWESGSQTELYVPWWNWPGHIQGPVRYFLRTSGDAANLVQPARDRLRTVHGRIPAELELMSSALRATVADRSFVVAVLLSFAGAGVVLAMVGVFGVVAYTVARRRREIGIRVALGASRSRVRSDVRGRALRAVGAGSLVGVVVTLLGAGLIEALLYEVPARDPVLLVGVLATFLATAYGASEIPTWRATRVDPAVILRD